MQQLEAHEVPLHKIFSSDYDFRIPDYQRPYAWQVEQAAQLLEDLVEALDRGDDEPYFLGSVVLVKRRESSDAEVIDGQQRLTTLTILLAVLRDLTGDEDLKRDLDTMLVEPGNKIRNLAPKPRLALRARDAAFFKTNVQTSGAIASLLQVKTDAMSTDAQRAVQANARVFRQRLADWSEDRRLALVGMLSERTFLVVVSTPDLDSAHRIFSVMNARGLDLSPADIFKSLIIGELPDEVSSDYATKWENAEESLGRDDFADLFLHLRMVFSQERARRELLKEFPEQVLSRFKGKAAEFVDDVLLPYASAYQQMRDQSYTASEGAGNVNRWFRRLAQIDNSDWRPPALWALRHHGDDPEWLDAFLRQLERLAASMLVRRVYATPRAQRYSDLLKQLGQEGLDAPAFELTEQERAETIRRLQGDIYLVTAVRKYVLLRLDEKLANVPGVSYEHKIVTVEHVLPQNPAKGSEWLEDFTEEERSAWTHRLGNLVLLNRAKNAAAQNFDFGTKKDKYFTGKSGVAAFALTIGVLAHDTWTPGVLEKRQEELLQTLVEEWDLGAAPSLFA
ncbi:DUF262 domain-containing protein [Geodermatophilus sp. SYSU D00710]